MRKIEAAAFTLEPQLAGHAEEMFIVLTDPAIYEFENEAPASLAWLRERYARLQSRRSPDGKEQWLNWIVRLPSGEATGYVQATIRGSTASVGYEFGSRYWGRGLASRAVQAMLDELARSYGVCDFAAVLKARNFRSLRLLERLGFVAADPGRLASRGLEPDELLMLREGMPGEGAAPPAVNPGSMPMDDMTIHVHALDPARLDDFLKFFDGPAFSDNPRWASCYCQCFLEDHRQVKWADLTAAQNRASACTRAGNGQMQGYLAYRGGEVVGWCNAAPRRLLHALDAEPLEDAHEVGVIACFVVAPGARGQGIARALLGAACDGLARQGLRHVEANPRPAAQGPAQNHTGPLSLYLGAGFTEVREDQDGSVWVRKDLGSPS
jgi:RimJ/RimL family protein N-acetyltransferase